MVDLFLFFLLGFFYLVRNCEIEREMNNLSYLEPDYSEFVEVDPTGRYGRYNEVLGKGASKTL